MMIEVINMADDNKKEREKEELRERLRKAERRLNPKKVVVVEEYGRAFLADESEAPKYCENCQRLTAEKNHLLKENEELKKKVNRSFWDKVLIFLKLKGG